MKKFVLISALVMFAAMNLVAQDINYSNNFIKNYGIAKSNAQKANATIHDGLWLTQFVLEAKKNWKKLTPEAKALFPTLNGKTGRPTLPSEQIFYSQYFDIHYTLTGAWAVNPADNNTNGDPDYVEDMAAVFDAVYLKDSLNGFAMPPRDAGAGGSDFYDVYIGGPDISSGTYGFVSPEDSLGNNPDSPLTETNSWTSWMCMNYDYSWASHGVDTSIAVTAAHEFMHAIQMGYNQEMNSWFKESSATWAEDFHFPGYDDNLQYLGSIFSTPDASLTLDNWDDDLSTSPFNDHWYGTWIFTKYMTEQTNDGIIKEIFERCISDIAFDAIDAELTQSWSTDFYEIFGNWLVANYFMTDDTDYDPYTYTRATVYDNTIQGLGGLFIEGDLIYTGSPTDWVSDVDGNERLMRLSADYCDIISSINFSLTLTPDNTSADMDLILVKENTSSSTIDVVYGTVVGTDYVVNVTDASSFDSFEAIVVRYDETAGDTLSEQYTLTIGAPTGINENINSEISIYPNPAKTSINIASAGILSNVIVLNDLLGNEIYRSNASKNSNQINIDVQNVPDGLYFLSIFNGNDRVITKKINILH